MKEYMHIIPTDNANRIKVEVYYSLGGMNYFTYENESRGYYLSVSHVNHATSGGVRMESFVAFTGTKQLILPCKRRSAKREAQANELAKEQRDALIQYVLDKNGLTLTEKAEDAAV